MHNEGVVRLESFDREAAEALARFFTFARKKDGGVPRVMQRIQGKDPSAKISQETFVKGARRIGYKKRREELENLYVLLDSDGLGYITARSLESVQRGTNVC